MQQKANLLEKLINKETRKGCRKKHEIVSIKKVVKKKQSNIIK